MVALSRPATTTSGECSPLSTLVLPTFSCRCDTTLSKNDFLENFWWEILSEPAKNVHEHISSCGKWRVNLDCNNHFQDKPICMGYLSVWQMLQHVQDLLSELYFEWMGGEIEKHKVFDRVFQHNRFLNKRIWIHRYFQTHCQLSKFPIRDMPFKTKFTALVNARGLTDSASLKIIRITTVTLRAITDLNFLGGGVVL